MEDASERIVNLALYLGAAAGPVSAEQVRSNVAGYPAGQDGAAFARMFERDKDVLRDAGLVLTVDRSGTGEAYRLDPGATFAEPVELDVRETLELRAAGAAMLADPSFPYAIDLRHALAKLMAGVDTPQMPAVPVAGALSADEDPVAQGESVALLTAAAAARKRVTFDYTGAGGKRSAREVEPWGLFAREGRWYLVAFDRAAPGARVFAIPRMRGLQANTIKPKSPDFQRPVDFDVRTWMLVPFQYGVSRHEAVAVFTGHARGRARALAAGQGESVDRADGTVEWRVPVADDALFARWVVDHGPGIAIESPESARDALEAGLRKVVGLHG
ncbi:MAG: WYL domain-containing protein [Coriobacteriia bacterium]|nr:WYL domain-containing protein [Coriobacteriia bacterium]